MADALLNKHHNFVLGFECGKIYHMMKTRFVFDGYPVMIDNRHEIELIAREFEYEIRFDDNLINKQYMWLHGKQKK